MAGAVAIDAAGRMVHFCAAPGCGEWGSFGVDYDGRRYRATGAVRYLGIWYCGAHIAGAQAERAAIAARARAARIAAKQSEQGEAGGRGVPGRQAVARRPVQGSLL